MQRIQMISMRSTNQHKVEKYHLIDIKYQGAKQNSNIISLNGGGKGKITYWFWTSDKHASNIFNIINIDEKNTLPIMDKIKGKSRQYLYNTNTN